MLLSVLTDSTVNIEPIASVRAGQSTQRLQDESYGFCRPPSQGVTHLEEAITAVVNT
jgi:hypothetical protein